MITIETAIFMTIDCEQDSFEFVMLHYFDLQLLIVHVIVSNCNAPTLRFL